ncbi:hypothetical protein GDO86_018912 [Hymenochirus boettgeri]|uniref:Uncharacterized protein n=1 Tax=Hymenochirus boettgeri TaxID=247094 RepID=A0A8T2IAR3_9PIPI|nr:hypothetical protein GDO86_018912 [Hymenochirus boettgeri]
MKERQAIHYCYTKHSLSENNITNSTQHWKDQGILVVFYVFSREALPMASQDLFYTSAESEAHVPPQALFTFHDHLHLGGELEEPNFSR